MAVVAVVPRALEDDLAVDLGVSSLGVEVVPAGPRSSRLRIYVSSEEEASLLLLRAVSELGRRGMEAGASDVHVEPVEDLRWVERYQEGLRPFPLGDRFVVVPRPHTPVDGSRVPVTLVPGRAFGTGEHATTRLCARALEERVCIGSRWLDLGCGSGILSVVAALCGASRVEARDTDPEAVEVAREVLEVNGVADRIGLRVGSADALAGAGFDGVAANIEAAYFVSQAGEVAAVLRDGGVLLATGFLEDQEAEVALSLARAGISIAERRRDEPWSLLVAERRGAGGGCS